MSKHGTALTEGQLAEFLGAGVKALSLISNNLGPELAHNWANNGQAMQHAFLSVLAPQEQEKKENQFLSLFSGNELLMLDAADGTETIKKAKNIFSYIDSDFKNWDTDQKSVATEKTPVAVYEMKNDATFAQMFNSLSSDTSKLCLTQHQILNFIQKYRNWLRTDGWATFFLFESHNHFFVARVGVGSGGSLGVCVRRFGGSGVWRAGGMHRLVVPQLA